MMNKKAVSDITRKEEKKKDTMSIDTTINLNAHVKS